MREISKAFTAGLQSIVSSSLPISSSNILRERRVKRARVLCRMAFPGRLFTRDQVVTFQSEACFPRALFDTSVVLFESHNEKITATRN